MFLKIILPIIPCNSSVMCCQTKMATTPSNSIPEQVKEIVQAVIECKMGLTSLHDFYASRHLYICCSLFGHLTFFVTLLVFLKGTSCYFIQ